ncbi:MAG: VanW family protein, partial [Syntrophomonas sp.]
MHKKMLISLMLFIGVFFGLTGQAKAQESEIGSYAIDLSIAVSSMNAENACLAGTMLDGVVVNPGEEFSFNDTVGMRTTAKGFSAGYIASQSRSDMAVGGGVCMTASILHQAVKAAGLEVLERNNHCIQISYLPLGEDAAVQYGVQDFRFRNNLSVPVIIRTTVDDSLKIAINIEDKPKNVYFNGSLLKFDTEPVIYDGVLLVPAWTMAESLQAKVSWIAE